MRIHILHDTIGMDIAVFIDPHNPDFFINISIIWLIWIKNFIKNNTGPRRNMSGHVDENIRVWGAAMAKPVKPSVDRIIKSGLVSRPSAPGKSPGKPGKLIFFTDWCKKCGLCTAICPHGALKQNGQGSPVLDDEKCRLCSMCWRLCPDFAIVKNSDLEGDDGRDKA